jgi:hypothetical protein
MKGNFWMLVSEKIQHACALILPKKSTSMCFDFARKSLVWGCCKKLGEPIKNIVWSHHLQVIEKDTFALMYQSIIIK